MKRKPNMQGGQIAAGTHHGFRADLEREANALLGVENSTRTLDPTTDDQRMTLDYGAAFSALGLYDGRPVADMVAEADAHDYERMRDVFGSATDPSSARRTFFGQQWESGRLNDGHNGTSDVTVYLPMFVVTPDSTATRELVEINRQRARTVSKRARVGEGQPRKSDAYQRERNRAKQAAHRERKRQERLRKEQAALPGKPA